jgi:hypothetical protein
VYIELAKMDYGVLIKKINNGNSKLHSLKLNKNTQTKRFGQKKLCCELQKLGVL